MGLVDHLEDGWFYDYCNLFSDFLLSDPEDGVVEVSQAHLDGTNDMGTKEGWCHIENMADPAQTYDPTRNADELEGADDVPPTLPAHAADRRHRDRRHVLRQRTVDHSRWHRRLLQLDDAVDTPEPELIVSVRVRRL